MPFLARVRDVVSRHGDRSAVIDPAGSTSFAELWRSSHAVAAALDDRGLSSSRVALLVAPGAPWIEAFLGTLLSGGTVVALSPLYPEPELRALVAASRARALVASDELTRAATAVAGTIPVLRVAELVRSGASTTLAAELPASPDDVALLLFTSGTTGRPKAARLTHENVHALARVLGDAWRFTADDVLLHTLPLHHLHGIGVSVLVALAAGASTRFVAPFDAARVWEELARATVLMGVPTQHKKLFDAFDAADAETRARWQRHGQALRLVTSGSAALPPSVGKRWRALSGRYPLERYGMTEVGIVLSNPVDGERRAGTIGVPLPGVEIRIVAEDGADAPRGEPGEIWVRAPTVFAGYDGNEEATRAAFADGWFRTGDTAVVDSAGGTAEGYVKILGRTSTDILKSGGYKLSALEIEDALREHEAIADVAVIGLPDETWGDLVLAAVVPVAGRGAEVEESALRAWARERLAPYKVPKRVVVMDELPRNALGKVTKAELRARILNFPPRPEPLLH